MPNDVVIPLLAIAGFLNIIGTVTVAINYANGARLGREIKAEIDAEDEWARENPVREMLKYNFGEQVNILPLVQHFGDLRRRVAFFLRPQPLLIGGIVCYVIASILDTMAGIGALIR
jgi:hypothetical protein